MTVDPEKARRAAMAIMAAAKVSDVIDQARARVNEYIAIAAREHSVSRRHARRVLANYRAKMRQKPATP